MKRIAADSITSRRMSRQARRDTTPEKAVRAGLRALGRHYRLNVTTLPGSPDIANKSGGWAIFVNGCYWHHHPGCHRATIPKKNQQWWLDKFRENRRRDETKVEQLEELGFDVLVVWECETSDVIALESTLMQWFHVRNERAMSRIDVHKRRGHGRHTD